jgi:hypothetical protein
MTAVSLLIAHRLTRFLHSSPRKQLRTWAQGGRRKTGDTFPFANVSRNEMPAVSLLLRRSIFHWTLLRFTKVRNTLPIGETRHAVFVIGLLTFFKPPSSHGIPIP